MPPPVDTAKDRLNFRLGREHKELIQRAAMLRGLTLTNFAITELVEAARAEIESATNTRLSLRDRDIFLDMLDNPPEPNPALRKAAEEYKAHRG